MILNRVSNMNSKDKLKNWIKISFRLAKNKRNKSNHPVVKIQKKLPVLNERILNRASNMNSKKKNTTIKISFKLAKNKRKISNYLAILIQNTQKITSINKAIHFTSISYPLRILERTTIGTSGGTFTASATATRTFIASNTAQSKFLISRHKILNRVSKDKLKNTTIKISFKLAKNKRKISNYLAILIQKTKKSISLNKNIHLPSL